ncbi:nuclear transport factor 2 family protein [Zhouia spongiae]|uniref:Nuclear transport factor 2 family protein n=1 Tax=Zhouia spongiae TaxID=2202721 RepID=A0ABY3YPT5_9FLAO|nr:nuclear transport factor 2 family protein [Zhouia spongiae]UNY99549.1 nuclear transport factor 2 family protein [Zhouia spongiae]
MEKVATLVSEWFDKWTTGDFLSLPVTETFTHTSPFGTIEGKRAYIEQVIANKDKFLGYTFDILDALYYPDKACVRYIARQDDFKLEVSEWYYIKDKSIDRVVAYYHIGEIREDRKLNDI